MIEKLIPADTPGCGYRGAEFGCADDGSICAGGALWDVESAIEFRGADVYTVGGLPCPNCNKRQLVRVMAGSWFLLGYKEVLKPVLVKDLKRQPGIHDNWARLGLSRPFRRHYLKGRRVALSEEKKARSGY